MRIIGNKQTAKGRSLIVFSDDAIIRIVVPCYNKTMYLADCLKSIQNQTFERFECVVVDDGSADGDVVALTVDSMKDRRFRCVRLERNRGPGGARNAGAAGCKTEFLIFVDEDDELKANCLEVLLQRARETGAAFTSPWAEKFGLETGVWRARVPEGVFAPPDMYLMGVGVLISRAIWEKVGGFDESENIRGREDHEFWIRALRSGAKAEVVAEPLYRYRRENPEVSLSSSTRQREVQIRKAIVNKHWSVYREYGTWRRAFIAEGYKLQAEWEFGHGHYLSSVLHLFCGAALVPSRKHLKALVRTCAHACRELVNKTFTGVF